MEWLADRLTSCLLRQNVIDEKDKELYRFGIQSGIEMMTCYLVSLAAAVYLHRVLEYLLFSIIFIPVRSYAGGLHLPRYSQCFICSCLVITAVIFLSGKLEVPLSVSIAATLIMLLILLIIKPVNHENRPVDEDEQHYFTHKLRVTIFGIGILAGILFMMGKAHYLFLVMLTLASAIISMFLGKLAEDKKKAREQKEA